MITGMKVKWLNMNKSMRFSLSLVVSMMFLIPLLTHSLELFYPDFSYPILLLLSVLFVVYSALLIMYRSIYFGTIIAVIVTSTFAANVPLASNSFLRDLPGHLGPQLWLFQLPLAILISALVLDWCMTRYPYIRLTSSSVIGILFIAYILWSFFVSVFANPPRQDVALYAVIFLINGLCAFLAIAASIIKGYVSIQDVITTLSVTIIGHSIFGFLQFINQTTFGITRLGEQEVSTQAVAYINMGPLGTAGIGTIINGFSGHAYILAGLILLISPVLLTKGFTSRGWKQYIYIFLYLFLGLIVRITSSDAARGAYFTGLIFTIVILFASKCRNAKLWNLTKGKVLSIVGIVLAIFIILYPSSVSSSPVNENVESSPTETAVSENTATYESTIEGFSVPYFDLSNLGIRIEQYIAGINIFEQNPILGIGSANFRYIATQYGVSRPYDLHNILLALLVETGLPGLLLYMGSICGLLRICYQLNRISEEDNLLYIGLVGGILSYIALAFWDPFALVRITAFVPFWIIGGAIAGESSRIQRQLPEANTPSKSVKVR
jgi:O-antigen ligase